MYDSGPLPTSWEVYLVADNADDKLVASSSESDKKAMFHTESICLLEGKYKFIISDGYYYVTTSNGVLIAEGGYFEKSESITFSIPFVL